MKRINHVSFALKSLTLLGGMLFARSAFATCSTSTPADCCVGSPLVCSSPYGNSEAVRIAVGTQGANTVVTWQKKSDDTQCITVVLDDESNGLPDDLTINGTDAASAVGTFDDEIAVAMSGGSVVLQGCSGGNQTHTSLAYGGNVLTVDGKNNDDYIHVGAGADNVGIGGSGNDRLVSTGKRASLDGGSENDDLLSLSSAGSGDAEVLVGGTGNDCLYDGNVTYSSANCGDGTDEYRSTMSTVSNCETPVSSC